MCVTNILDSMCLAKKLLAFHPLALVVLFQLIQLRVHRWIQIQRPSKDNFYIVDSIFPDRLSDEVY